MVLGRYLIVEYLDPYGEGLAMLGKSTTKLWITELWLTEPSILWQVDIL